MLQNAQDIRRSHKVYRENRENIGSELTAGGKTLDQARIQRDIFQGDALSPLLFVIMLYTLPMNINGYDPFLINTLDNIL